MVKWLPLIAGNSLRNRRRTLLSVLSIAAGFCLLGVLMAMYHMFFVNNGTPEEALRLFVRNRISITNWLPASYKSRIRSVPGVIEAATFQYYGGTYKDSREARNNFARFGVDAREFLRIYSEYRVPDDQRQAFIRERSACLVGRTLANNLGWKLGQRIHIQGDIFPIDLDLTVRAIYDSQVNNEGFFFHYEYLTEGGRFSDISGMYVVLVDRPESVGPVSEQIDALFRNSTSQTRTESERAMQLSFLSYLGNVKAFLLVVCSALTLAVFTVSANTMGMSIRERVREAGVLKTLGFTPGDVLSLLLGESVLIALVGAAAGLGGAWLILAGLRTLPSFFVDMQALRMPPAIPLLAVAIAIAEGLAGAWFPARTAARISIIDALRRVD